MTFDLVAGRTAKFTFQRPDLIGIEINPSPDFQRRDEAMAFLASYVAARRRFLEIVATITGLRIAGVDDLPGGQHAIGPTIAPAVIQ